MAIDLNEAQVFFRQDFDVHVQIQSIEQNNWSIYLRFPPLIIHTDCC